MQQSRVACFIDGFNVYHALMEPDATGSAPYARYRWIDYRKLAERYVSPGEELIAVYYFTAYATWDEAKASRHRTLVSVQKDRGVHVVLGRYRPVTEQCRAFCRQKYQTYREKRTDVNIAIHLLDMAYKHAYDKAILVSGDSDLVPVVKHARLVHPDGKIVVVAPVGRSAQALWNAADYRRDMKRADLNASLLPERVLLTNGSTVDRPREWA